MNKFLCLFFSLSFISNSIWFSFILLLFFTRSLKWQQKSISNRNIQSISSAMVLRTCFRSHITHTHHNKYLMNRRAPIDYFMLMIIGISWFCSFFLCYEKDLTLEFHLINIEMTHVRGPIVHTQTLCTKEWEKKKQNKTIRKRKQMTKQKVCIHWYYIYFYLMSIVKESKKEKKNSQKKQIMYTEKND